MSTYRLLQELRLANDVLHDAIEEQRGDHERVTELMRIANDAFEALGSDVAYVAHVWRFFSRRTGNRSPKIHAPSAVRELLAAVERSRTLWATNGYMIDFQERHGLSGVARSLARLHQVVELAQAGLIDVGVARELLSSP